MAEAVRYFATCARGLEPFLADELRALRAQTVKPGIGGVHFHGDQALLYRANLWLRTAVRVLRPILDATVRSPEELYQAVRSLDWADFLTPDHTLAVDCHVRDSRLTHSLYAAQTTKDAICDQFRERCGRRPSVNRDNPMVGLNLHIHRNQAVLSLDSSVQSLHKRGYRPIQTKAPLNEALAAALLRAADWQPLQPLLDPMCGSGTFVIEAAWLALNRPPGLTRKRFGFQGWLDYDVDLWTALRDDARLGVRSTLSAVLAGSDVRGDAVEMAQHNARSAGVGHLIAFHQADVADLRVPDGPPGVIVVNPPYGERLGEEPDLLAVYRKLGDVLARLPYGWRAFLFSGNATLTEAIRLPVASRRPFFNGRLPCEWLEFDLT